MNVATTQVRVGGEGMDKTPLRVPVLVLLENLARLGTFFPPRKARAHQVAGAYLSHARRLDDRLHAGAAAEPRRVLMPSWIVCGRFFITTFSVRSPGLFSLAGPVALVCVWGGGTVSSTRVGALAL